MKITEHLFSLDLDKFTKDEYNSTFIFIQYASNELLSFNLPPTSQIKVTTTIKKLAPCGSIDDSVSDNWCQLNCPNNCPTNKCQCYYPVN